ncbi:UNVERIFIED_CONTAM: hypothetical protein GTU68_032820 [Idotea baltica]|nr:hypothetical protein [Idotea baltica]
MRTLATLQNPDNGTITFNGVNIVSKPDAVRRKLGYLPQDFGVYPRMSCEALLNHIGVLKGLTNKKERVEQVQQLLHNVNLYNHRWSSVSTFSGGMRQRFGVAQAMLGDPKILIVDEPTAGLDPFERQRFLDLLSEAGEDKIIILSTHIVEDVRDLCADMAILGNGELVARGQPEHLINKIRGQVWRKKIDKSEVEALQQAHNVLSTRLLMGGVLITILAEQIPNDGFEPAPEPTLEDAYFAHLYRFI